MKKLTIFTAVTILAAAATSAMTGCEAAKNATGLDAEGLAKQCGLECNADAVAQGQGSISGVANVDAFFTQVANFNATAKLVADGVTLPLVRIKAGLGFEATATPVQVTAAIAAKYQLDGGIKIAYAPPSCQVSASASVEASARCEGEVTPPKVEVECSGRCEAEVTVTGGQASCSGSAKMQCTTPSVTGKCEGSCKGECKLEAGATCTGTCSGTCGGKCDGTCDGKATETAGGIDCAGTCEGKCSASCTGKCDVSAGGSCQGSCEGSCAIEATGGSCTGNAKVECFVEPPSGSATVKCDAKCSGGVTPPSAKVECQASAKAEAQMKAECTPPAVTVTYAFAATADATVKAQFEDFKANFTAELGAVLAGLQRSKLVLDAGVGIAASIPTLLTTFQEASVEASADLDVKAFAGLGCAVTLLPKAATAISTSTKNLSDSVSASSTFVAALK